MEKETAGERGFRSIPALSRASDADEELAADALKGAGQPELTVRDSAGGLCRRGHVADIVSFALSRRLNVAVHYGLK